MKTTSHYYRSLSDLSLLMLDHETGSPLAEELQSILLSNFFENYLVSASIFVFHAWNTKIIFRNLPLILPGHLASCHNPTLNDNSALIHTNSDSRHGYILGRLESITPTLRTHSLMHDHQSLYNGMCSSCQECFSSILSFIGRLTYQDPIVVRWKGSSLSDMMDRCRYMVPHTSRMVQMPINGGQNHLKIGSVWISHLVHNLPLSPVMVANIASAQHTNQGKITTELFIITF